jgi:secreted trypsin-like serine protease
MKKFKLPAVLLICSALAAFSTQAQQPRIINGKPASTSTYPWMASLFIQGNKDSDNGGGSDDANCGTPGSPGVYASISALAGFITEHVTGMTLINSLADVRTHFNFYDPDTETVTIPKVYVDNLIYSVTLKLKDAPNLHFFLATAEDSSDDPNAIPSFFDGVRNKLILPQVRVGADTFNVTLRLLENTENYEFVVETADDL